MLLLYNAALLPLRVAAAIRTAWARRNPAGREEWNARTARRVPSAPAGALWLHGASVGEARITRALAAALRARAPGRPIVASAITTTGLASLPEPPDVDVRFLLPIDIGAFQRRLIGALRPAVVVLVETELWPNLIGEAARSGVAVCVVNGRLSPERMRRYRLLRPLFRAVLEHVDAVGAQSAADAERFRILGAPTSRVRVTGNIKYDLPRPAEDRGTLRARLGLAPGRPVVVAGSTGAEESPLVLDAFLETRRAHPSAFLVLAPRRPERFDAAVDLVRARGLRARRHSENPGREAGEADVLVVDALGHLAGLYPVGDAAFVGGSLVPVGGHNVLEPAAAAVAVLFGPHTHHVVEPAAALLAAAGARRVADARELAAAWTDLLSDRATAAAMGERAASVVTAHRGALDRSATLVLETARGRAADPSSLP